MLLLPTGMVSVLNGTIDDGYNGMLGWFWVACAVTTIVLVRRHPRGAEGAPVLAPSWPPPGCSTSPSSRPSAPTSWPEPLLARSSIA